VSFSLKRRENRIFLIIVFKEEKVEFSGHKDVSAAMIYAKADNRLKMKRSTNLRRRSPLYQLFFSCFRFPFEKDQLFILVPGNCGPKGLPNWVLQFGQM
jgi:hypothetical protein